MHRKALVKGSGFGGAETCLKNLNEFGKEVPYLFFSSTQEGNTNSK